MDKYIKLEPLLKELEENTPYNWSNEDYEQGEVNGYKYAVNIVEAQDIADIAEVKHGKWEIVYQNAKATVYECSECKHLTFGTSDYCICGARMDGDGE